MNSLNDKTMNNNPPQMITQAQAKADLDNALRGLMAQVRKLAQEENAKQAAIAEKNDKLKEKLAVIKAMEAKEIAVRIRKTTEARVKADNEWVVVDGTEDWELIDSA